MRDQRKAEKKVSCEACEACKACKACEACKAIIYNLKLDMEHIQEKARKKLEKR